MNDIPVSNLLIGDIGLSTENSWLANTIKWFEKLWTKDGKYSHAWMYTGMGNVVEALVKISINPVTKYNGKSVSIYRVPLTDDEQTALQLGMLRRVNGAYGWLKYPLFMLDAMSSAVTRFFGRDKPVFFFTNTFGITNIPVCSELVVYGLHKFTSYKLKNAQGVEVNWRDATPAYLYDLLQLSVNKATLIFYNA